MSWQELAWTPDLTLEGWPQDVTEMPVSYFSNSPDPDTLVFNGLGGSLEDLEDSLEYLGRLGKKAAGIELTYLKNIMIHLDPDTRQEITNQTLLRSGLSVMDDLDRRSNKSRAINFSGPSKGGAEALLLAGLIGRDPKLRRSFYKRVGSVAAVNTIGVANRGLGQGLGEWVQEAKVRKREFAKRMAQNVALHADIEPSLDRVPVGDSARVKDALMYDGTELVIGLVRSGVRVRMFSGEQDIVAPTSELIEEIGDYASIVEQIPGHHASLANDIGKRQLLTAVEWSTSRDTRQDVLVRHIGRLKVRAKTYTKEQAHRLEGNH